LGGHAISCYSLRQMEHDADLYETKIAGPEAFREVIRSLRHLSDGFQRSMMLLERGVSLGRCADNFIALLQARTDVAAQYECWLHAAPSTEPTHWYDTHPSPHHIIDRAAPFPGSPALTGAPTARRPFSAFHASTP